MKLRLASFLLSVTLLTACQRGPTATDSDADRRREEQLRQMDERIAQLQALEKQAADRKLAETEQRAADSDAARRQAEQDRQKAERERIALQKERDELARNQKDAEARAREAERVAQETADRAEQDRAERTVDLFYTALQPHGDWFEVDRYGYVWQPNTASDPRWRPYTDGRWVFSEYGWFWQSNEPFGWAAYHYGRWARLSRIGWVWIPGTEWGPAWVSWRRSDRYIGWAPLPPDAWSGSGFTAAVDSYYDIGPGSYTFVPVEEVGEATYVGHVVAPEQNVTIVNQTVNVTNITYTKVENNTVIYNAGPDITVVNARAAKKVPQMKVQRVTNVRDPKELGRAEQKGSTLVVAAPEFSKAKPTERPRQIKEKVKSAEIETGWSDLEQNAGKQAREKIKREASDAEARQRQPRAVVAQPVATPAPQPVKVVRPEPAKVPAPAPAEAKPPVKAVPSTLPPSATPASATGAKPAVPAGEAADGKSREPRRKSDSLAENAEPGASKVKRARPVEKEAPAPSAAPEQAPAAAPESPSEPTPVRKLPKAQRQRPADLPTSENPTTPPPAAIPQQPVSKPEQNPVEKPSKTKGDAAADQSAAGKPADVPPAAPEKSATPEPAPKRRDAEGVLKPFAPRPAN